MTSRTRTAVVVGVVVLAGLVLTVGALLMNDDDGGPVVAASSTRAPTSSVPSLPTTTSAPAIDTSFTDPGKVYTLTLGADWKPGPPGFASSPTWSVPLGPPGTAEVNPLLYGGGSGSVDAFVALQTSRLNAGGLNKVTSSEPTTLADGTAGAILRYTIARNPQVIAEAVATSNAAWGVLVIAQCPVAVADSCFAGLDPYLHSVHLL